MTILEYLNQFPADKLDFQMLSTCMMRATDSKKAKCTRIEFGTNAVSTTDVVLDRGRVGVVLWIDRDEFDKAKKK